MRVFMVALALVVAPLAIGASQDPGNSSGKGQGPAYGRDGSSGRGHDDAHCAMRAAKDATGRDINKCVSQDPPPPPPPPASCGTAPAPTGASGVTGQVFTVAADGFTRVGLANWCVIIGGTVSAGVATDALGNYSLMGLPDGTYTVCEVLQTGWTETAPGAGFTCPSGIGYSFSLTGGQIGSFLNFRNMPAAP